MNTVARSAARLIAALVVAMVMVGPVIAVAYAAGTPIPPDLADRLGGRNIDDATIVKILSLCFYACWAWFCGPALRQLWVATGVRHRTAPRTVPPTRTVDAGVHAPSGTGPRGWLARLARFAAGGMATATTIAGVSPLTATAGAPPPTAAVAAGVLPADDSAPQRPSIVDATSMIASHRDTPYAIARRHFPPERIDTVRDEIVELNIGRPLPDGGTYRGGAFPAGWNVVVPAIPTPTPAERHRADDGVDHDGAERLPVEPAPAATAVHVVTDGESYWLIAEDQLHLFHGQEPEDTDVLRHSQSLIDLNAARLGHDDPQMLYVDDEVHLVADRAPIEQPAVGGPVGHVVTDGESYWSIAEDQLRVELAREPADHEVLTRTDALMAGNAARLGYDDPALLHIGDIVEPLSSVTVASPPTDDTPPVTVPAPIPTTAPVPLPPPAVDPPTIGSPPAPPPPPPRSLPARPQVAGTEPGPPSSVNAAPAPVTTSSPLPSARVDVDVDGLFDWSQRSVWASIPIGVLLAAGLTGMTRRLRGRRLSRLEPGEQTAAPPAVAAGTELAVSSRNPERRLSTLHGLLRTVTPYAREQADPPAVRSVELAEDRIEILFTSPAPFPPQGWATINGGTSWVHRFADVAVPPVRQLVTPALVTLGLRPGGGEVLLDLETAGSLALTGDRAVAQGMARAMTLELATYPLGVAMDVCLIGFDVDGADLCDRTWKGTTLTRAVRVAREVLERTAATGAASLIAARAATDDDEALLDPHVFIVDAATVDDGEVGLLDELIGLCIPQSGAAVVVIGDHPAARERVTVTSDEVAHWSGATLRPTPLDREAVAQVAVMFDHAANAAAEPLVPSPMIADLLDPVHHDADTASSNGGPVGDVDVEIVEPYRYTAPEFDVLVRVLGDVAVEGRPITSGVDVEMLSLLAFKRDQPPNVDTMRFLLEKRKRKTSDDGDSVVHDPLWESAASESAVKTLRNRASVLRRNLGVGADGADLLPTAAKAGTKGRYRLSPRVLTDVDLIEHRYHMAIGLASGDALPLLRDGLTLFAGPAFRGGGEGYAWIAPEGVLTRITNIINAYATLLMQLAFDVDDLSLVLQTAAAAGRVIDDPVALLPMCEVQRQFAEASGDPDLAAAVVQAHRRLLAHAEQYDPLAGT